MTQSSPTANKNQPVEANRRASKHSFSWDWLILPALALGALVSIPVALRAINLHYFLEYSGVDSKCVSWTPESGPHGIPNAACWYKVGQEEPIEYRFNACGDHSQEQCNEKPPGTYRIVLIGASTSMGIPVRDRDSFATLLPQNISRLTGRNVEVYDEGVPGNHPRYNLVRFDEAIGAHPDLILWAVAPTDIERNLETGETEPKIPPGFLAYLRWRLQGELATKHLWQLAPDVVDSLQNALGDSRIVTPISYVLCQSQSEYVRLSLLNRQATGFLQEPMDSFWQERMATLDGQVAQMAARAHEAGVPFVAVLLPNRAQAAMLSMGTWPPGYSPYILGDELQSIVARHGGIYLDFPSALKENPNSEQLYFPVDGHPHESGHAFIAAFLAQQLTNGVIPELRPSSYETSSARNRAGLTASQPAN